MEVQRLDVVTQQSDWLYGTRRWCGLQATNDPVPTNTLVTVRPEFVFQEMAATSETPAAFTHSGAWAWAAWDVYTVGACFWFAILRGPVQRPRFHLEARCSCRSALRPTQNQLLLVLEEHRVCPVGTLGFVFNWFGEAAGADLAPDSGRTAETAVFQVSIIVPLQLRIVVCGHCHQPIARECNEMMAPQR